MFDLIFCFFNLKVTLISMYKLVYLSIILLSEILSSCLMKIELKSLITLYKILKLKQKKINL